MAASVNPIIPSKQPLKGLNRSPKFLRNGYNMKGNAAKRKSAVELLQESKAYYVKSEQVLDSKQELKHTEHLQVTSNPSYDTLLRHPHRGMATHGWDVPSSPSSSSTAHPMRPPDQRSVASTPAVTKEPKMLTVTLCSASPRLRVNRSASTGGGSFRSSNKSGVSATGSVPAAGGKFGSWASGPSSSSIHVVCGSQPPTASSVNQGIAPGPPIAKGGLPPKSPRTSHLRSKTQPEMPCPPVRPHEYRRSHSEKDNSDDIQMKLRRLLYTDSKENLNANHHSDEGTDPCAHHLHHHNHHHHHHRKNNSNNNNNGENESVGHSDRDVNSFHPLGMTDPACRLRRDSCNNAEPILKPRHQQEGVYSIHKSMPDLSPLQLGTMRRPSVDDDGHESLPLWTPKNAEVEAHGRTTSDYVSHSPSSRKECLSEKLEDDSSVHNGRIEDDDDSFAAMDVVSATLFEPGGLVAGIRRRPILRSKSDISHRYSKSGTDLSNAGSPKRNSRAGAELERFFDTMGLDSSILYVLKTPPSDSSEPVFFNSVSTGSSSCCLAGGGETNPPESDAADEESNANAVSGATSVPASVPPKDGITNKDLLQHGPVETSIVERNARVIKWLFNCRKVQSLCSVTAGTDTTGTKRLES